MTKVTEYKMPHLRSSRERKAMFANMNNSNPRRSGGNPPPELMRRNNPRSSNDNIRISLRQIKKLRDDAVKQNKDRFFINGQPILVSFAKFWIPFIEGEIKRKGIRENEKITVSPTR